MTQKQASNTTNIYVNTEFGSTAVYEKGNLVYVLEGGEEVEKVADAHREYIGAWFRGTPESVTFIDDDGSEHTSVAWPDSESHIRDVLKLW